MSAISGISSLAAHYIQANNQVKATPAQPRPAAQTSAPASGNDSDGDNDSRLGANIDVHA